MKLNNNQAKALARKIHEELLRTSPKRKLSNKEETFISKKLQEIEILSKEKDDISNQIKNINKQLHERTKEYNNLSPYYIFNGNSLSVIKKDIESKYVKAIPPLSTIEDDINISTIDGDIKDIDSFIQKMVKKYI